MKRFLIFMSLSLLFGCSDRANAYDFHATKQWVGEIKQPVPAYFLPKTLKIVALGDSLTQGVGDEQNRGGYLFYLERQLNQLKGVRNVQIDNYGVKGFRSDQLLSRIESNELKEKIEQADFVLLTIGGNDIMKVVKENFFHLKMEDFQERQLIFENNLNGIFRLIKQYNSKSTVFLIGLYNPFSYWFSDIPQLQEIVQDWNETGKQVASFYKHTYFVPIAQIFSNYPTGLLYEDQFHPNGRGYELIAETVFSFLQNEVIPDENNEWFVEKEDG